MEIMRRLRHILLLINFLHLMEVSNETLYDFNKNSSAMANEALTEENVGVIERVTEELPRLIVKNVEDELINRSMKKLDSNITKTSNMNATSMREKQTSKVLPEEVYLDDFKFENFKNSSHLGSNKSLEQNSRTALDKTHRKPVKLTMKQGLIMNQILGIYALENAEDVLCRNHTKEFKIGLRAMEPWALKMFDSSSKLQAGILNGNLFEFGAYSQCIRINYESSYAPIYGKICFIQVKPTLQLIKKILSFKGISEKRFEKVRIIVEKSMLSWTVCVPHSCSVKDTLRHYEKIITELTEGLVFEITLNENHCYTLESGSKLGESMKEIIALSVLTTFILIVVFATVLETYHPKAVTNGFIDTFSATSNIRRIFAHNQTKGINLECLHGLRFLSTMYVILGHRYLMAMFFPVANGLETLDWILNYASTTIIGGHVCVDTFFLISALLVSVGFLEYVTSNNEFNIFSFYSYRYLRITLPLSIVVLVYATLLQHLGSGPLWYDTYNTMQLPCQYFWWSTLLHIQGYTNPHAFCVLQTWSLSADMPYFYASPIILYPLWKYPKLGILLLLSSFILSVFLSFYLAWINEYEGGMPITGQLLETKYFQRHYVAPHARISPYLIGLGFGYFLFKTKDVNIKISRPINFFCWMGSFILLGVVILGCHNFQLEDHPYNRMESSLFLACSRSAWTIGLCWMIFSCMNGDGGIINTILSSHIFKVLGRVSYGMYLLHMMLQFLKCGASKIPIYFSDFNTIYDAMADLSIMVIAGFLFTVLYELPLIRLVSLIIKTKGSKKQINPATTDNQVKG